MNWKSHIEALVSAGAKIDQIASRMGVTPQAVREILAGRTKAPRASAAFKLAKLKPSQFAPAPSKQSEEVRDVA